jgi:hypothetical protein
MADLLHKEKWVTMLGKQSPTARILFVAMFLYAASLIKFYNRDPLSKETGPQGPIELILVIMAGFTLLLAFYQMHWKPFATPSAMAFIAFGAIATASSIFSFYPLLSFLKGLSFLVICGMAIVSSAAFKPVQVMRYLYYSVFIILTVGLVAKLAGGDPLFDIDAYSGRARFTMFAWPPGSLADLCALMLLCGLLLPKRTPTYCQIFLFAVNIATGTRASSALLCMILLFVGLSSIRLTTRFIFLCCCLGSLLTLVTLVAVLNHHDQPPDLTSQGQALYGTKLDEDLPTLNGRTEVWHNAGSLISHSILFGYGFEGARDVLINNTSWNAGTAHNSLLDLILAGGIPATILFLFGWVVAAKRALWSQGAMRVGALATYAYIAGFGIVTPNLTYMQGIATFLIITIDAMGYREAFRSVGHVGWVQLQTYSRSAESGMLTRS